MKYVTNVLKGETLRCGILTEADPGNVSLADVLNPFGAVYEVVYLTFQNGLKVLLQLASRYVNHDGQGYF